MDPDEIVEHIPGMAKAATALGAAVPFTAIVKRMLGPAADELAEMLRDQVRLYRYERQLKCLEKAEQMAKDAGFTPQPVPPKILFPLVEGASFEEDEDLHTMWAALLANAASPEHAETVRPGFIAILKQMAADEGLLLNALYDHTVQQENRISSDQKPLSLFFTGDVVNTIARSLARDLVRWSICLDRLQSPQVLQRRFDVPGQEIYMLTISGRRFVEACRPPKPKENG
jgi:hypothetical protein